VLKFIDFPAFIPGDHREEWADGNPLGVPAAALQHKVRRELLHHVDPVEVEHGEAAIPVDLLLAVRRSAQVKVKAVVFVDRLAVHREQLKAFLWLLEKNEEIF
jgi:hypothetical protein